jgi:hypothetical protein
MESVKMANAISMESLDNCSTVSSVEVPSQVRTLFVSGLPVDTKPRELYLLFRAYPGYENSLLKMTNKNGKVGAPVGFVTFSSRQDADEARIKLQGVRFDPESSQTIRLELARSNTKVPKPKQPSPPIISPATLPTILPQHSTPAAYLSTNGAVSHADSIMTASNGAVNAGMLEHLPLIGDPQQIFGLSLGPYAQALQFLPTMMPPNSAALAAALHGLQQQQVHQQHLAAANGILAAVMPQAQAVNGNMLCSTLFVANLGNNPCEEEVRNLFKAFPGFCRLRMHNKGGSPVAFVEYQDVRQAAVALSSLQGFVLNTTERGQGIRIEYAKTKMGDVSANLKLES